MDARSIGVFDSGVGGLTVLRALRAAGAASRSGRIAVIATEGTVQGGSHQAAIHAIRGEARGDLFENMNDPEEELK